MAWRRGAGERQGPDFQRAGPHEGLGARLDGGAGGPHVIDQDDNPTLNEPVAALPGEEGRDLKGALDVAASRGSAQTRLGCGGAHASERAERWHAQPSREVV